jgi:hypothetical protein
VEDNTANAIGVFPGKQQNSAMGRGIRFPNLLRNVRHRTEIRIVEVLASSERCAGASLGL